MISRNGNRSTIVTDPYNFMVEPKRIIGPTFPQIFDIFFNRHIVSKTPESLLLACEDPSRDDAWLVWWAEHYPRRAPDVMLRSFLRSVPYYKPFIGWSRPEHGRFAFEFYQTERLFKIAGLPLPPHDKSRNQSSQSPAHNQGGDGI